MTTVAATSASTDTTVERGYLEVARDQENRTKFDIPIVTSSYRRDLQKEYNLR